MVQISDSKLEQKVIQTLNRTLMAHQDLDQLLSEFSQYGTAILFGGYVRDSIHNELNRDQIEFRDFDVVIDGTLPPKSQRNSENNFGGRRHKLSSGMVVDYWELDKTYAFTRGLFKSARSNLLRTTVYTVNSCFVDLSTHHLHSYRAVEDIRDCRVAFNCKEYLDTFPLFQAFRAVELSSRLSYSLAPDVRAFCHDITSRHGFKEFSRDVRKHRSDISHQELSHFYRLCKKG